MTFRRLISISRPRFWLYEAGTFAVGAVAAIAQSNGEWSWVLPLWFLFFLIPANILIYGVNDVFDYETDKRNPKKQGYESVLEPSQHLVVLRAALGGVIPFILLLPFAPVSAYIPFAIFLFCAVFYSAPPIRAKARPVLDSLFSAGHYVATGWFAFAVAGGSGVPVAALVAGMAWAIAMHAYSAVPDIKADEESGLGTIATLLRARPTIILCIVLYALATYIAAQMLTPWVTLFGLAYIALMISSLEVTENEKALMRLYRIFPYLNAGVGAIIWWLIVLI